MGASHAKSNFPDLITQITDKFSKQQDPTAELDKTWNLFDKDNNQILRGAEIDQFLTALYKLDSGACDPNEADLTAARQFICM